MHDIREDGSAGFFALLEDGTSTSFAVRMSAAYEHEISENMSFSLNGTADYYGSFETGNSRDKLGLGVSTPINKFVIDDVWGATLTAGLSLKF